MLRLPPVVPRSAALAVSLACLGLAPGAVAQSTAPARDADKAADVGKLDDTVQKVEVKGAAADYDPRRDDTASKTVLSAEEIRKYGDDNIYDVLKRTPGVTVTGKTLRMRGLGAGYTQVLVNGDRPPPGFSLDALTPDQIERIEIVRAATAEFSMQAIAGTINIVLRKVVARPQRDLRLSVNGAHDSHGVSGGGTLGDKAGDLSYFLNGYLYTGRNDIVSTSGDRFTLPTGEMVQARDTLFDGGGTYRGIVLFPRLSWKLAEGEQLNVSASLQSTRFSWGGNSINDNLVGTFPAPDYVENLQRSPTTQKAASVEINWVAKLAGGKLDLTASLDRNRDTNDNLNDLYTEGRAQRLLRDWRGVTHARRHTVKGKFTRSLFDGHALVAGLESSTQTSEETRDRRDTTDNGVPVRLVETFAPEIERVAGFVQDEWSVDKQLSVYLGARWEGLRTESAATGVPDTRSRSHVLSPVAQALYKLPGASGRQLRLAFTRTYKAPTVQQLTARRYDAPVNTRFNADSSGNPDLQPELANGVDLGYEHFLKDGAMVSVSASRRAISDYIRTRLDVDAAGRWVYRPLNDGDALVRSLQLETKLPGKALGAALSGLDLRASYSRNWSSVSAVPGPGNRLDGQTPSSATVGADWRKGDLTLGSSFAWQQGGWLRISEAQSQWSGVRRDLDAYVLWKLNPRWQLRASVNNLLGTDNVSARFYQDASGTSREPSFQGGYARASLSLEMKL